jgi:hypothetical protein
MDRRLRQYHLESRPNMRFEQVTANDIAIGTAENGMEMQSRTLFGNGNIAEERQDLDLFIDDNFLYCFVCQSKYPSVCTSIAHCHGAYCITTSASTRMSSTSQKTSCATRQCPRTH